jgi:alpha-glucosidase
MAMPAGHGPWWRTAVIYEVYPRSFADATGDGEGDLAGLTSRLPYLARLGVDAVWIAPWYPSPLADGGYDITDYRDIHPRFGTLRDAEVMLDTAHRLGLRVIIDLVANHTSHQHPWFRAALDGGPGSPERERYLFRDGCGPDGSLPPNNWISSFGGTAWTRVNEADGTPGQWYLHTFAPEQPDLNWHCGEVRDEFDNILRFWLDRGVDGFRIDAAPAMAKAPGLPDAEYGEDVRFAPKQWVDNPHWDTDGVHEILRRWRALIDAHPGEQVFVAESVVNGPARLARYLRADEAHTAFNFDYVHARWDPDVLRAVIDATLDALGPIGAPATWALSSHDEVRHLTRYGKDAGAALMGHGVAGDTDLELGTRRARAAVLLTLALPGGAYLYQGEELGLPEVEDLPATVLQDPIFARSGGTIRGRDGCRVPLPWAGEKPPFAFSPAGVDAWLPQPPSWAAITADAQDSRADSMLTLYRDALRLRAQLEELHGEPLTWLPAPAQVLHFTRGAGFRCIVNMSAEPVPLPAAPLLTSAVLDDTLQLPTDAAAWIRTTDQRHPPTRP